MNNVPDPSDPISNIVYFKTCYESFSEVIFINIASGITTEDKSNKKYFAALHI